MADDLAWGAQACFIAARARFFTCSVAARVRVRGCKPAQRAEAARRSLSRRTDDDEYEVPTVAKVADAPVTKIDEEEDEEEEKKPAAVRGRLWRCSPPYALVPLPQPSLRNLRRLAWRQRAHALHHAEVGRREEGRGQEGARRGWRKGRDSRQRSAGRAARPACRKVAPAAPAGGVGLRRRQGCLRRRQKPGRALPKDRGGASKRAALPLRGCTTRLTCTAGVRTSLSTATCCTISTCARMRCARSVRGNTLRVCV